MGMFAAAGRSAWEAVKLGTDSLVKAGGWGAAGGVVAGAAGWTASQFAPEYVQSRGPFQSALIGGAFGAGGYAGYKAMQHGVIPALSHIPLLGKMSRFAGSAPVMGMGIAGMALKSIINTSFTRPANG